MEYKSTVNPDHPALSGHFPGNPLVPAVVLLDWAHQVLEKETGRSCVIREIQSAKFLAPVAPGASLEFFIEIEKNSDKAQFTLRIESLVVAEGSLLYTLEP